jgi:hypothetical protein
VCFVFGVSLLIPPERITPMVALAFKKSAELSHNDIEPSDIAAISGTPKTSDRSDREDIAMYLAQITGELAVLARSAQYDLLGYFLEMARIEAKGHAGTFKAPN